MSPEHRHDEIAQEDDRVADRYVTAVFVAGVVITIAAIVVSTALLGARRASLERPRPAATQRAAPREIGMIDQTLIEQENNGADVRSAQRRVLERWGWVDRGAGVARVPIERAMDLVVARENAARAQAHGDGGAP